MSDKSDLKLLVKVVNTLKEEQDNQFIKSMIGRLQGLIDSMEVDLNIKVETADTYVRKEYFKDYVVNRYSPIINQEVYAYEFVRGKIRKKFPDVLKEITKEIIKVSRNGCLASELPQHSSYWRDCHCVVGEDPYDNLDNCRAHYWREFRTDKDPVEWWSKEPFLARKVRVWRKDLANPEPSLSEKMQSVKKV
jgi:hypothetical protein